MENRQREPEYDALQKQEKYLDSLLNLDHWTKIYLSKKWKKDDETVGLCTAVSGLTNVSPQTQIINGMGVWASSLKVNFQHAEHGSVPVTSTLTLLTNKNSNKLEQENKKQKQGMNNMQAQITKVEQSVKNIVAMKEKENAEKEERMAW